MNSTLANLSSVQLQRAVVIKEKIEALEKDLASILGTPGTPTAPAAAPRPKRQMSAAGRKRIAAAARARMAAAAKARWAKVKAG
jgi:hypothetical protein